MFPQANLLALYEKLNLTQRKRTFTIHKNVLYHKINTKKREPGSVAFLRHPAWKRSGSILKGKDK